MKKLFSMALALVLCLSLSLTAFATNADDGEVGPSVEEPGTSGTENTTESKTELMPITIEGAKEGHEYKVYQIFIGRVDERESTDEDGNTRYDDKNQPIIEKVLSDVEYGANYRSENSVEDELKKVVKMGAEAFAKEIMTPGASGKNKLINENEPAATLTKAQPTANVTPGYYLIVDDASEVGDEVTGDAVSAYMVTVVGAAKIKPKTAVPEVEKQVKDNEPGVEREDGEKSDGNDKNEGWNATADHAINESFEFKLKATLPKDGNFASYDTYKLVFHDTMSEGITFEEIVGVKVNNTPVQAISEDPEGYELSDNVVEGLVGRAEWTITIADIFEFLDRDNDLGKDVIIEVIYKAHLNDDAYVTTNDVDTTTNINEVYLEYSNDPTGEGTGKTPTDKVYVFTYGLENEKVDGETGEALAGAVFTLYKKSLDSDGNEIKDNEGKVVKTAVKLYKKTSGNAYDYYVYNDKAAEVDPDTTFSEITTDSTGKFNIYGLDAGSYVLSEIQAPATYNKCDDIEFSITATHEERTEGGASSGKVEVATEEREVEGEDGESKTENVSVLSRTIENFGGTLLPSTGGIGTTIFYVVGGILIVSAVILLIGKKRMDKKVK